MKQSIIPPPYGAFMLKISILTILFVTIDLFLINYDCRCAITNDEFFEK